MPKQKDFAYRANLKGLVCHALLHLLCKVSQAEQRASVAVRNDILIKYLKKRYKQSAFANVKKEIRMMLHAARRRGGNLEWKLYQLNEQVNDAGSEDAEQLYALLNALSDQVGIETHLQNETEPLQLARIYMVTSELDSLLDPQVDPVTPLAMLVPSERLAPVLECIDRHGYFLSDTQVSPTELPHTHVLLSAKARRP
ncbi:DUF2913 family protein [Vibrio ouci]|uniref:DUF2913 family protein n=1 Tax=Vibrio ouci TaxID=2499078 RepID=A0A4Y8WCJ0_9VIBR|nr:DUF2913 family protein [Vibrio ouci]TFH90295.1 DUF2913 family protein [Vibrio ouci]